MFFFLFQKIIDYLKFDIEQTEWEVLQNIVPDLENVKQIGIEIHLTDPEMRSAPNLTTTDFIEMFMLLKKLDRAGFKKFNYRLNPFGIYRSNITGLERSRFYELHYLNLNFAHPRHIVIKPENEPNT